MRNLNSLGLEVIHLDCQALGKGMMARAQALMLMNLIISRCMCVRGIHTVKTAALLLRI